MYHFPCIASGIAVALREGRCPAGAGNLQYLYLRTLGTLNESLPEDTTPPLAGSIDEIDALNLPPVLRSHVELLQVRSLAISNRDQFQGRKFCRVSRPPERIL